MKPLCLSLTLVAGIVRATPAQSVIGAPTRSPEAISVFAPSGWSLHIKLDGSGHVQFGSLAGDGGPFKASTFEVDKVVKELQRLRASDKGGIGADFGFTLLWKGKRPIRSPSIRYTRDARVIPALIHRAIDAVPYSFFDRERRALLLKESPPAGRGE